MSTVAVGFERMAILSAPASGIDGRAALRAVKARHVDAIAEVSVVSEPAAHDALAIACQRERTDELGFVFGAVGRHDICSPFGFGT